jgi:hypothetical protein
MSTPSSPGAMANFADGPGRPLPVRWDDQTFEEWVGALTAPQRERFAYHVEKLNLKTGQGLWAMLPRYPMGATVLTVVKGGGRRPKLIGRRRVTVTP